MRKRAMRLLEGVDNVELFYDLIFVYCISVMTGLLHHPHDGFVDWGMYASYIVSFLTVLQVWTYTTLLMNRYGTKSRGDYGCLLVNMFLLYFMASGISQGLEEGALLFNVSWALVLANLLVHWGLKLFRFEGLDADDRAIIVRSMAIIGAQLALVAAAALVHGGAGGWLTVVALLAGYVLLFQGRVFRRKPSRFAHIAERCVLLVIVTFGETVVALASYVGADQPLLHAVLAFAVVAGLFLIYDYEYDNMLDHHSQTDGMAYLALNAWIVLVIGHLTLGLEFMATDGFDPGPSSALFTASLVLYLLTSFLLARYNKPLYAVSGHYVAGRLVACAAIVAVALLAHADPLVNLACDTAVVFAVLAHEMFLYRGRNAVAERAGELGYSAEDMQVAGYTFETAEGRRAIRDAARDALGENRRQGGPGGD